MVPEVESQPKSTVVTLDGDIGLLDTDRVRAMLPDPEAIEDRLVLDCSRVNSMDSSILAMLMLYRRRVQNAGRDPMTTIVALAPPRLMRLFELTGISRVITVLPVPTQAETSELLSE